MSLERKDLRVYFDADVHAVLLVLAEVAGVEPAKWVERIIAAEIDREARRASVIAAAAAVQGLPRLTPDEHAATGAKKQGGAR